MHFSTALMLTALIGGVGVLPATAKTLLVPQQYPTIGGALKSAHTGDTVLVSPKPHGGVYGEAVVISTQGVTLQGCGSPIIDGTNISPGPSGATYGIDIQAAHVTVAGFTIRNVASPNFYPAAAINVGDTDPVSGFTSSYGNITISGNTLTNDYGGITITGYNGYFYDNPAYLTGYQVTGNTITGSTGVGGGIGASIIGAQVTLTGNKITGNNRDGLDIGGEAFTVSGNEIGDNGGVGLNVSVVDYNPAVNSAASPNPAPTNLALNDIHDNASGGVTIFGTATLTGNAITGNTFQGVLLQDADYSTVVWNQVTNSQTDATNGFDGQGILAEQNFGEPNSLTISYNVVSGNAWVGIDIEQIGGALISSNTVVGNHNEGIYVSDYSSTSGGTIPPNKITQNVALQNTGFDAADEYGASPTVPVTTLYGQPVFGDGKPLYNIWTNNLFGKADPTGLGR